MKTQSKPEKIRVAIANQIKLLQTEIENTASINKREGLRKGLESLILISSISSR